MKKNIQKKPFFIYGCCILAPFFVIILILLSPLFSVVSVTVEGNSRIPDEEIRRELGLTAPSRVNIFLYDSRGSLRRLNNPYIESASIGRGFLAREITVTVVERRLAGFVEFSPGQYLFIDENGLVLETATAFVESLPIVVGLDFTGFTVGSPLEVSNERAFENLVAISRLLSRHGMESDVIRVDVNDSSNIRLFINELDVSFGDTANGDQKIQTLIQILNHFEGEYVRGTLDISDISRRPILRHLT
ncbi:MAG: FtsQ-type POTRA domain-containing protein [Defluviitaleaceae bacterium]|nr:FtsQ-type POTRA domain-containing protein [Defluviitaleaceae bacterium]